MGSDHDEQNLSYFHTSRKSGSNFDTVMIEELVSEVRFLTRSDLIYGRHPELRRPSRSLSGPSVDLLYPPPILGNPPNRSLITLANVSLSNCSVEGRRRATLTVCHWNQFFPRTRLISPVLLTKNLKESKSNCVGHGEVCTNLMVEYNKVLVFPCFSVSV